MSLTIRGANSPQQEATVTNGRLWVDAETNLTSAFQAESGLTFNVISHDATAAAGTHPFYFKNDSTTHLFYVDLMRVGGVASILWKLWEVTGTAAGGSALTPANMNLTSGVVASATARGDDAVTGLTQVTELATVRSAANNNTDIPFDDTLILGNGDAIAMEADAVGSTDVAEVLLRGYFKAIA